MPLRLACHDRPAPFIRAHRLRFRTGKTQLYCGNHSLQRAIFFSFFVVSVMTEDLLLGTDAFETAGPAPPATRRKTSSPTDAQRLKVFISYSRADLDFADQLDACLDLTGFDSTLDRQGIHAGEEWQTRLGNLIRDTDTIVFVLSPTSAVSKVCAWEVEEAHKFGKRIIPICCRPLEGAAPPELLSQLNYIFFYPEPKAPGSGFGTGLTKLVEALSTDLDWLREHTRLLQRASEWQAGGQLANRLLSGTDIAAAKAWAARRPKNAPELSLLHLDYIRASEQEEEARLNSERQKLKDMALAQEERAKALSAAEAALKEAAEAQRRRAVVRNTAMATVTAAALVAVYFWAEADKGRESVAYLLSNARNLISQVSRRIQFNQDEYKVAVDLFKKGDELSDPAASFMLGVAYENGWSVPLSQETALSLYEKAASRNHVSALFALADLHADDPVRAKPYFEKAAATASATDLIAQAQTYFERQNITRARDLYERAARRDNVDAMRWLGQSDLSGEGVVKNPDEGRKWLEKAAGKDDVASMLLLAEHFDKGELLPQNAERSVHWYMKAAEKDDTSAMRKLAVLFESGQGVAPDAAQANQWLEKIAGEEGASAMTDIGLQYENGQGFAKDFVKARNWYERAAKESDPRALSLLAEIIIRGKDGSEPDQKRAIELLKEAAQLGHTQAFSRLGYIHHFGEGVEIDGKAALEWYQKAAEADDTWSMIRIGELYLNGVVGIDKDPLRAREWFEKAVEKGDTEGWVSIGYLYEEGLGVDKSVSEAKRFYEKAAAQQNSSAILNLGVLAYYGRGKDGVRDFDVARQKFEEADQLGNTYAATTLGIMSQHGQGGPRDYAKAHQYYLRGLANEDGQAADSLAWLYADGKGVDRDFAKAREYLRKAERLIYLPIKTSLARLDVEELEARGELAAAIARQTKLVSETEAEERTTYSEPRDSTTVDIDRLARLTILARDYDKALAIAEEAIGRLKDEYKPDLQKAHALMFLNRADEAKAIYSAHKGWMYAGRGYLGWEYSVEEDFARFRAAGLTHPLMAEIEKGLGLTK